MRDHWAGRGRKAKHFMLAGLFRRQLGEARNPHAVRESPFNGGSDEVRPFGRLYLLLSEWVHLIADQQESRSTSNRRH